MSLHGQDSFITESFVRHQSRFVHLRKLRSLPVKIRSHGKLRSSPVKLLSYSIKFRLSPVKFRLRRSCGPRHHLYLLRRLFRPQSHRWLIRTFLKVSLQYFAWRMDFVDSSGTPCRVHPPFPLSSLIVGLKISMLRTIIHARTVTTLTTNTRD